MIRILSVILVTFAVLLPHQAAATAKSDLRKLGMKRLTGSEEIAAKAGQLVSGVSFTEDGRLNNVFRIEYRKTSAKRGKKIVKLRRPGGGGQTNVTRKWRIRGGKFCEESFSEPVVEACNDKDYRLGSTCYYFHGNGNIWLVIGCPLPE